MSHRFLILVACMVLALPSAVAQYTPEQIHVSAAGTLADSRAQPMDVSQIVIHWSTAQPYLPHMQPRVKYTINGGPEMSAAATLVGMARDTSPPTARDEHDAIPVYAARIQAPLSANLTYSVGEGSTFSAPASVKTMPKPTGNSTLIAMSYIGYKGYGRDGVRQPDTPAPAEATIRQALNQSPDVALLVGNLGHSSSSKPWNGYMRSIEPLHKSVIAIPVPGDAETPDNHHHIRERYVMPHLADVNANVQGDETELLYHGFTVGPVYVIGLDSTSICTSEHPTIGARVTAPPCTEGMPNQAQMTWLHDTLEDLREDYLAPWIVVYVNHGPYIYADDGDDMAVRQLWVPLLETFNVDLVIHSNEPIYQRTHPLRNQVPLFRGDRIPAGLGPVYVTPGTAGYYNPFEPITHNPPDWIARIGFDGFSLLRLDATNRTLKVSAISAENGTVFDSFILDKDLRAPHLPETSTASPTPPRRADAPGLFLLALSLTVFVLHRQRRNHR